MKKTMLIVLMMLVLGTTMTFAAHDNAIWGTYVTYKSSTDIYITVGSGRCNGSQWELTTETTLDLYSVLPAGEDFLYIYVDDSASSYPAPTFVGSATEPAWSDSKVGWYNGDDRCIGVVWCDSNGNIVQFQNNSSHEYFTDAYYKQVLTSGNPNGAWQTVEATAYLPINATAAHIYADNTDSSLVSVMVSSYENQSATIIGYTSVVAIANGWLPLARNASRDLRWFGQDNDDNNFVVRINGFRIER